jgi:class 3 adenylate cyclase
MAGKLPPGRLVAFLNSVFSTFDGIVEKHGLEKIKTIGDAYLAAAGLPEPRADHASAAARAALEMMEASRGIRGPSGFEIALRIGMHSGPVVAGVIGKNKFSYDLWGDTVNVAARMESHGVPGEIQVSGATRALLVDHFELRSRGAIEVKGKGELETFLLVGER